MNFAEGGGLHGGCGVICTFESANSLQCTGGDVGESSCSCLGVLRLLGCARVRGAGAEWPPAVHSMCSLCHKCPNCQSNARSNEIRHKFVCAEGKPPLPSSTVLLLANCKGNCSLFPVAEPGAKLLRIWLPQGLRDTSRDSQTGPKYM